jgi:hypothetical protein
VNGQTVLNIPMTMAFYEEKKKKRKSRWGEKELKKSKNKKLIYIRSAHGCDFRSFESNRVS